MLKVNKIQLLQYQKYYKVCHVLIRPPPSPVPRPPSPVPWIRDQELFYLVNVACQNNCGLDFCLSFNAPFPSLPRTTNILLDIFSQ